MSHLERVPMTREEFYARFKTVKEQPRQDAGTIFCAPRLAWRGPVQRLEGLSVAGTVRAGSRTRAAGSAAGAPAKK
jgi:hypothetical protein